MFRSSLPLIPTPPLIPPLSLPQLFPPNFMWNFWFTKPQWQVRS